MAVIAALAMAAATGCGGEAAVETVTVTESAETQRRDAECDVPGGSRCATPAEQDLWARLRVGVVYADYVKTVGDISVEEARIPKLADAKCAEVRQQLRGAILWYKRASEGWLCRGSGCNRWKVKRQIRWQEANARIKKAEQLLAGMG